MAEITFTPEDRIYGLAIPTWKRTLDVIGATLVLVLLSPLLFFVAFCIKLVSPGPVFFKQERVGRGGEPFTMWKFRTMHVSADTSTHQKLLSDLINGDDDDDKPMTKIENDPRIIPMGGFLRKSCIDELPQLINVLAGHMSMVGPRPAIPYEANEYLRWHRNRFDSVPGMTGLWQVSGKNRLTFKEMVRLDIRYNQEMSVWLDASILLRTPIAVLQQVNDSLEKKRTRSHAQ